MSFFNKDEFKQQANSEGTNNFKDVLTGAYDLEIERSEIKKTTGGAVMATFAFSISDDDPNFPGQWVWQNFVLTKKDGSAFEDGRRNFNSFCMKISDGMWDLDAFLDNQDELSKFIGTTLRAKVKKRASKDPEYGPSYDIKPMVVNENIYSQKRGTSSSSKETKSNPPVTPPNEVEVELKAGMAVAYKNDAGETKEGKVLSLIEQTGQIAVQNSRGVTDVISADRVLAIVEERLPPEVKEQVQEIRETQTANSFSGEAATEATNDLDLELEEDKPAEPQMRVGATVAFTNKGVEHRVKVNSIDENEGKISFELNGKSFKLPIASVKVVG